MMRYRHDLDHDTARREHVPNKLLWPKEYGTIDRVGKRFENLLIVLMDDGSWLVVNKLWGCGGGQSSRVVRGTRIKVYQRADSRGTRLHYRLVGR